LFCFYTNYFCISSSCFLCIFIIIFYTTTIAPRIIPPNTAFLKATRAPALKANGGGAVVNVLSAGAIVAVPVMGGYSPSKFAARAASTCLRAELAPQGTHVAALIVGSVDTRMSEHITGRVKATPRDIARAGIIAVRHNIDEHDTDPHAIEIRAFTARDPHGLATSMAKPFLPA
jgi:NAD(P)-dependent dehydrogenase (short-subunit alcohol dehydrogenase family)